MVQASGTLRAGIGGWKFDAWNTSFYPEGLPKTRQLEYASQRLSVIEVNATYYSSQKPSTFAKWAETVPGTFVFALKASRFCTNRKRLSEAEGSVEKFLGSGLTELGDHLGPILWQFTPTKSFQKDDFESFLQLLPEKRDGISLRHAVEVRHPSFLVPEFVSLARKYKVSVVCADHPEYPMLADMTSDFIYARLQNGSDENPLCYTDTGIEGWAERLRVWASGR